MKRLLIFLALTACAWSQPTMPFANWKSATAAYGSPWATIDSCFVWFEADAVTDKADGDTLFLWPDKSPYARRAVQMAASSKPTYQDAEINGRPVIRFDGADDFMAAAYNDPGVHKSVIVVWKALGANTQKYIVTTGVGASAVIVGFSGTIMERYNNPRYGFGTYSTTGYKVHMVTDSLGTRSSGYEDGVCSATRAGTVEAGNTRTTLRIGSADNSLNNIYADIVLVAVYGKALTEGERKSIEAYLKTKYGLALP